MGGIRVIYFSATGTTERVCKRFSCSLKRYLEVDRVKSSLKYTEISTHNITFLKNREILPVYNSDDIVILGVPTIAGRVPNLILPYLKKLEFNNAFCIPIVLFGNRNYDDSLIEMSKLIENKNGRTIAGAAIVGEHSFSYKLAKDRPNEDDLKEVDNFAKKTADKILDGNSDYPKIKGYYPFRDYFKPQDRYGNLIDFVRIKPKTIMELCDDCKLCVKLCPLGSINYDDVSKIDGKCMKCCACIKKCHKNAKYFDNGGYIFHTKELETLYYKDKKNEFFI